MKWCLKVALMKENHLSWLKEQIGLCSVIYLKNYLHQIKLRSDNGVVLNVE